MFYSLIHLSTFLAFLGDWVVKNLPANAGDIGLIPELERFLEEGNGNPLQYSCLGHPMEPGRLQSMGLQKSRIWLNDWTTIAAIKILAFGDFSGGTRKKFLPWCREKLRVRREGGDREWDGWMKSLTQRTWVCGNSGT